jgi:hypothetical protein
MSNQNQPPEKPEYVLFVSQECKYCMNFINKVKSKPELLRKFNIVDIDSIPTIPDEVDEVPFVYDGKGVYQGKQAFTWLNEKMLNFLDAAGDSLCYSFLDGQEEQIFNGYSLLDQKNGCFGMDPNAPTVSGGGDPTRMAILNDNSNKNRTLESIMAQRTNELI